jgi:hypothetical protein
MGRILRRLSCLAGAGVIAGGVLAVGAVTAAGAAVTGSKPVVCSGTPKSPGVLTGRVRSDVVVRGACEVNAGRAVVAGNLSLSPGSALLAAFARNDQTGHGTSSLTVRGAIHVGAGATLLMGCDPQSFACLDDPHQSAPTLSSHASVGGDMSSARALGVIVHNASIGGDVSQFAGGGGRNCTPSGVFKLFSSPVYSTYEDSSVAGDVVMRGVNSCWMGMARLQVGGSMLMWNNKLADPDAIEIIANNIAHNLVCSGNSRAWDSADAGKHLFPRTAEPNTVGGQRFGQCVLASPTERGGHRGPGPF